MSGTNITLPTQSSVSFDPLICASLHNQIIAILSSYAAEFNNRVAHNFFLAYADADAIRGQLSPPFITFLENIDVLVSNDEGSSPVINFTPHLSMPNPNAFWLLNGGLSDIDSEDHENWVILYLGKSR